MASSDFHVGDLQGQIEEINEQIGIQFVDSKTGTGDISLPSGWKELNVVARSNVYWNYAFSIFPAAYMSGENYFRSAYDGNNHTTIKLTDKSKVSLVELTINGSDATSGSNIYVYCRK